jgi:hypothetical protein
LQKAYELFLQLVAPEQAKVNNQFIHPKHPLVVKHAALPDLIKKTGITSSLLIH